MTDFTIIYSKRRTICAEIGPDGSVKIRAPQNMRKCDIQEFVKKNEARIVRARQKQAVRAQEAGCKTLTAEEIAQLKEKARNFIPARVKYFSEQMGLFPSAVKISSAVRRFGSCSAKNSLNFSYRLMLYPQEAVDYVIVHELAHIVHRNHGKEFYALISCYLPDYRQRIALLRR